MVYAQPRIRPRKGDAQTILWDFAIQTEQVISARRPGLIIVNKKKRTCRFVDFAVPADHRVKLKGKREISFLDLARKLKKLRNMKVMMIPIVISVLGIVTKVTPLGKA